MERSVIKKQILIYVSELLSEKKLISSLEKNIMKRIIEQEEMQGGKSGNL